MRVCFAGLSPTMVYEDIQPVSGPTLFQEFLDEHGEGTRIALEYMGGIVTYDQGGIHHIAYDCNNTPFEQRKQCFQARGFELVQAGKNYFAFSRPKGRLRPISRPLLSLKIGIFQSPIIGFLQKRGRKTEETALWRFEQPTRVPPYRVTSQSPAIRALLISKIASLR